MTAATSIKSSACTVGDVIAGKFRIDRIVGEGGMGVVVEAMHLQLEERVALKFLKPEAMGIADVVMRFDREARAAAKLKSEHVAKVIDVGKREDGIPYMVMEYLEGKDLAQVLAERGPLDISDAVEYVIQACEGVGEAHARGIVHRDIKPENLFLAQRADGWTVVKVLDFGISKAALQGPSSVDMQANVTSVIMGSPYYMSPEQLRSTKSVDHRADIWSLGIVLFELLTGTVPFDETKEFTELVAEILESPHRQLGAFRADAPPDLEAIVNKCLTKDRTERFQNTAELAIALLPFAPKRARVIVERTTSLTRSAGLLSDPHMQLPPSNFPPAMDRSSGSIPRLLPHEIASTIPAPELTPISMTEPRLPQPRKKPPLPLLLVFGVLFLGLGSALAAFVIRVAAPHPTAVSTASALPVASPSTLEVAEKPMPSATASTPSASQTTTATAPTAVTTHVRVVPTTRPSATASTKSGPDLDIQRTR